MISLTSKRWFLIFLVISFLAAFLISFKSYQPQVKFGDFYIKCNPNAKIKLNKTYRLQLWDTEWPLQQWSYKKYMQRVLIDFQKKYPNIKVKLTLLDLGDSSYQLSKALKSNSAPDVYCSAFTIPNFDLKHQIPVGLFLKPAEKLVYYPQVLKLTRLYGVECYFPRWIIPTVWVGNRFLLESMGLSTTQMQQQGYKLADLLHHSSKLLQNKYLLVGNLGFNGLFSDLVVNYNHSVSGSPHFLTEDGIHFVLNHLDSLRIKQKIPVNLESNMMDYFTKGNSALLGGVRPIIFQRIKTRFSESPEAFPCDPILLPSPAISPKQYTLTENGVIGVYRNKLTDGDDHISAAVKLGQFISTYTETGPFKEMMLLPAAQKTAICWSNELKPIIGDLSWLRQSIEQTELLNLPDYTLYQQKIYPILLDFFNHKLSVAETESRIINQKWP